MRRCGESCPMTFEFRLMLRSVLDGLGHRVTGRAGPGRRLVLGRW